MTDVLESSKTMDAALAAYERIRAHVDGPIEPFSCFRLAWQIDSASCWVSGDAEITVPPVFLAKGKDNHLFFGYGATPLLGCHMTGSRGVIYVGPHCNVKSSSVVMSASDSLCVINAFTVADATSLQLFGTPGKLVIGENCYFGSRSFVSNSDTHGIYDAVDGRRINDERDVMIGRHVYLGKEVVVGKGVVIGDGAMVLPRSIVTGTLKPRGVYWGIPASMRRDEADWFHQVDMRDTAEASRAAEASRLGGLRRALDLRIAEAQGSAA